MRKRKKRMRKATTRSRRKKKNSGLLDIGATHTHKGKLRSKECVWSSVVQT